MVMLNNFENGADSLRQLFQNSTHFFLNALLGVRRNDLGGNRLECVASVVQKEMRRILEELA